MSRSGLLALLCMAMAGPLSAGVVNNRFVIVDESYDFERVGNFVNYRSYNFNSLQGISIGTQAQAIFSTANGSALSQYDAAHNTIRCMTTDYLTTADVASALASAAKPAIVDLTSVIFQTVGSHTSLRSDWQPRITNFMTHSAGAYNQNTVLFMSVHAEVTGTDLTNSVIDQAAIKVKQLFPGVKVAAGYPTTGTRETLIPSTFPANLDLIVTWDYGIADPRNMPYSDTMTPKNPATKYGRIASALRPGQGVYFLVAGFNDGNFVGSASEVHRGTNLYFGTLMRNWCAFSLKSLSATNSGLIVWRYGDGYDCSSNTVCGSTPACVGPPIRTQTGSNQTFAYEASVGSTGLAQAYRAISRAAQFNESCWAP